MTPQEAYENLESPEVFISLFKSESEFRDWLKEGTRNDLKSTLFRFTKAELYEYCSIIQSEIDLKVDVVLLGFGFND